MLKRSRLRHHCGCWQPARPSAPISPFCSTAKIWSGLKTSCWCISCALRRRPKLFAADAGAEQQYGGKLKIQTVVSRETVAGSLTGPRAGVNWRVEPEDAVGLPLNAETSHVMLCGNPQMVRDTQQLLKDTRQMTKHLRRRPGPYDRRTLLVISGISPQGVFTVFVFALVPINAPRSTIIITKMVGSSPARPTAGWTGSIAPVSRHQHPRQNNQKCPRAGTSAIVQAFYDNAAAVGHSNRTSANAAVCVLSHAL